MLLSRQTISKRPPTVGMFFSCHKAIVNMLKIPLRQEQTLKHLMNLSDIEP